MIQPQFMRSQILLGEKGMEKLSQSRVAILGLGGVGGHAAEALARTGVGELVLVDNDTVSLSNVNRQAVAFLDTVGKFKTDVMAELIYRINPQAKVFLHNTFYLPGNDENLLEGCDYVIDAIDTVSGKVALVQECFEKNIPLISSMGAGNKLECSQFEIDDIYQTSVCPLCRVMRQQLKKRGIPALKVVYSKEPPAAREESSQAENDSSKRQTPGSLAYVPSVAGMMLAGEVVKDLTEGLRPKTE